MADPDRAIHFASHGDINRPLSVGITPNIVMKWTGHSDYKAMKPYIDIVDSIKASSMAKFYGLIENSESLFILINYHYFCYVFMPCENVAK